METPTRDRVSSPDIDAHLTAASLGASERIAHVLLAWAGPMLCVLFLAVMGYQRRWVTEDAFISLRVVEHILLGDGPVFNRGERVEAYTHPLWVAILTVWGALGLSTPVGAVVLGIVFTLTGLIAGLAAASRLSDRFDRTIGDQRRLALPVGALIFVALPVVWDFTTSGLETGLTFAWLGGSYWLLVRACFGERPAECLSPATLGSAIIIGLGPLVRPDLALFSAGFLLVLIIVASVGRSLTGRLGHATLLGLAAAALPLAYQIFRMGYFAALVPNTAFAKEASVAHWSQGWIYLRDFTDTYHLWLPLLVVGGFWAWLARAALLRADRQVLSVMAAPVVSALLHAIYVVRVGGDFMHGRFLLPTFFALLLPVMLVRVPLPTRLTASNALAGATLVMIAGWGLVAARWLRVPYWERFSDAGLADERSVYTDNSGHPNPIFLDDYMGMRQPWPRDGRAWHDRAAEQPSVLIIDADEYPLVPTVDPRIDVVALGWNVGLAGYAAGVDVHVADRLGLSDPIASRLRLEARGRPGHEKRLPPAWAIARFSTDSGPAAIADDVAAARTVLGCGEVNELLDAVAEPMSVGRFLENLTLAWSLHDLRIPADPQRAVAEHC